MKTKAILFFFILGASLFLSFTLAKKTSPVSQKSQKVETSGGLISEDRNQWN